MDLACDRTGIWALAHDGDEFEPPVRRWPALPN
jgi:hypothetical protein